MALPIVQLDTITTTKPLTLTLDEVAVFSTDRTWPYLYRAYHYKGDEDISEYISRKYSKHNMACWVATIDPISFTKDRLAKTTEFDNIMSILLFQDHIIDVYDILVVMQNAQHTGLHAHICYISKQKITSDIKDHFDQTLNKQFEVYNNQIHIGTYEISATYQEIKSTCSYINYLQSNKTNFAQLASNMDIAKLFKHFDRTVIFPAGSTAKKSKLTNSGVRIESDNELVLFFMKKLHDNTLNYNEVLRDPNSQRFLHFQNLKNVWENCVTQFRATIDHEMNINHIIDLIFTEGHDQEAMCACAVHDMLYLQGFDIQNFHVTLLNWLIGRSSSNEDLSKKNALLFIGPPDTGKSFLARTLWELFYCHERIINDGIFSFAPAPSAGCLLWEEPHISPELADITKLVLEGNTTVSVAIKNKPAQNLGKRVPIIITTNKSLGIYCTDSQGAFDARCHTFEFTRRIPPVCKSIIHECDYVYPVGSFYYVNQETVTLDSTSIEDNTVPQGSVTDCSPYHYLTKHSLLTYLAIGLVHRCYNTEHRCGLSKSTESRIKELRTLLVQKLCVTSKGNISDYLNL